MIRKQSSDTLRFLFGSLVCYPPFAGTRSYATQTPLGGGNIANLTTEALLPSVRLVFVRLWLCCFTCTVHRIPAGNIFLHRCPWPAKNFGPCAK